MIKKPKNILIIAEAGVNHNGDINKALELVDVAADAGADIIKFQSFKSEKLVNKDTIKASYQYERTDKNETQFQMLKNLELEKIQIERIINQCAKKKIEFLSTAFDEESLEMLVEFGIKRIKIPSGEITNGPMIFKAAQKNLPMIISTGMSTLKEIESALKLIAFIKNNSNKFNFSNESIKKVLSSELSLSKLSNDVTLLHCTTEYPAPFESINLNAMKTLKSKFCLPVGYSDHSVGISVSIASAALGATVIEKHITLDKSLPGPDHQASIEPNELFDLVESVRAIEQAMGSYEKNIVECEKKNKSIVRKSLVASKKISKGELFSSNNMTSMRPGYGLSPMMYWDLIGIKANKSYENGESILI